mmetsp:Transcript_12134/g.20093  ORF Transcript_12134/g.20093 Transcript_12134/m.20093 type:complete len:408 (+) Transcript_12134:2071-3294(+)|eukprot:CAMPEP_0174959608 /NCGR_PEP_ID=MMETSP0004_2-20121128/3270_1 /TAXON_ID=420556 /ORGANISM="Ochromonas sp., Strain CCMP1393" /LENGTH=407 /DNA_ID=CAMNT_0016207943 /DNA_START=234 /DNA_END=1457 /DNA_ORIENTATION=-
MSKKSKSSKSDSETAPDGWAQSKVEPNGEAKMESGLVSLTFQHGVQNNLKEVKDALYSVAAYKLGLVADIFETGEYPVIAIPPEIEEVKDLSSLQFKKLSHHTKQRYTSASNRYDEKVAKLAEDKPKLYAMIFSVLSLESKDRAQQDPDWNEATTSRDPLKLWKLIQKTHYGGTGATTMIDRKSLRDSYSNLKQGPSETMAAFKLRFQNAVDTLKSCGIPVPDLKDQAMDFLYGLDRARFLAFIDEVKQNASLEASEMPKTVNKVADMARAWIPRRQDTVVKEKRNDGSDGFAGNAVVKKRSAREKAETKEDEEDGSDSSIDVDDESTGSSRDLNKGKCRKCFEPGHWANRCPHTKAIDKHVKKFMKMRMKEKKATSKPNVVKKQKTSSIKKDHEQGFQYHQKEDCD